MKLSLSALAAVVAFVAATPVSALSVPPVKSETAVKHVTFLHKHESKKKALHKHETKKKAAKKHRHAHKHKAEKHAHAKKLKHKH